MPNTKTNRDGLLVTENVRIFLMKTDGNGPGAAGKESVMNLLGMRSLGKIKEKGENEEVCPDDSVRIDLKEFFLLAVATSIDALAVGITFAFLQVKLASSVTIIGCITFCFTIAGVLIGNVFGTKFKDKATILGGVILIAIGVKILLEHLGIFG